MPRLPRLPREFPAPPPLRAWGHTWRFVVVGVVTVLSVFSTASVSTGLVWLNAGVALVAITAVVFRRRYPGVISIGLSALTFISSAAFPASALALVSLATRRRMVPLVVSSILFAAANVVNQYTTVSFTGGSPNPRFEPMLLLPSVLLSTVFVSALVGWGIAVGNRRELIRTLSDRAERAEAERETRAESARITERSRIAREMHDVLAHRITQISMQAGALSYRGDLTADELRAGTAQVRDLANSALDELRGVLGVLRTRDGALLTAPQPTLHDIDALIEEWRGHGMRIEFTAELATGAAPSALTGRTLYRAIQEALTNAGKHAPGAAVSVRLSGDAAAGITLVVRNPHGVRKGDLPQSGFGLVGLRERIDAVGGTLEVTSADGEFCILVRVPWSA